MTMSYSGPVPTEQIRQLPTPELAMALLRSFGTGHTINANNMFRGAEQAFQSSGERDTDALLARLSDAWAWLVARGLIGPHAKQTDSSWKRVTSLGREVAGDTAGEAKLWAADRLAGILDPALEEKVRPIFNLGDYETACFAAMKAVEVEVRSASGLDSSLVGVDLMRQAFKPGGPLTDPEAHGGEVVALMELFAGSIGAFKNPASHRTVHFDDPVEAAEVVQLADLLLRLLRRAQSRGI
ncbi:TIGR02391 family protein [Streptomyces sp. NBC_00264]|uniref:TIGR02391 family protein n=1 Tax=unclassified Streptomyces TaxID=2593676 RepID=UPI002257DEC2|nr:MULTISPECIES: TIGR02391 family protein [unclassified Streptomyces]MCX5158065.1 TIGR02391 family protein [Streptomyces sp. NBC_00305]MCX5216588.1 TIGR02391 family protein [Streptomyces sp. NBC_00264]